MAYKRINFKHRLHWHIETCLSSVQWLPIFLRVKSKVLMMASSAHRTWPTTPSKYNSDLTLSCFPCLPPYSLPATLTSLMSPKVCSGFGPRDFALELSPRYPYGSIPPFNFVAHTSPSQCGLLWLLHFEMLVFLQHSWTILLCSISLILITFSHTL